ncbi:MAG: LysR family transcriptional regulator [Pikeienuella sp.]
MDWRDLHVFSVLAREGSLAATARALGVNHATVSRRIAALEQDLGRRLVRRLARSTPLTEAGRDLAGIAGEMARQADSAARFARAGQGALDGRVRISAPPVLASEIVIPAMAGLRAAHPRLGITVSPDPLVASLDRGEADIALRMVAPGGRRHMMRRLGALDYALYAATETPPGDWRFIAFDETMDHVPQQAWLRAFAAGRPVDFLTGDFHTQLAAAEAGLGVALLPVIMGAKSPKLTELAAPRPAARPVWLVIHADLRRAPAVRAVADALVEACASLGRGKSR